MKEHWKDYSDREQLTKSARNLRRYKQELYLSGVIEREGELKDDTTEED